MAFQLASAFVRISARMAPLEAAFGKVRSLVMGSISTLTSLIGKFGGLAGGLSLGFAVKLGADAEEMQQKFNVVFGEMAADAEKFAATFSQKVGRSVVDTKKQLSDFQDILVPLGFARGEAAGLSEELTALAVDLASFNNKSDTQATEALVAALTGERERLKGLGVVISEADVKTELLARGQAKLTGEELKQAKALATLTLIRRSATDAIGDAERSAGSFTNRMKGLTGVIKDLATTIGSALLPGLAKIAEAATEALRKIRPKVQEFVNVVRAAQLVMIQDWDNTWNLMVRIANAAIQVLGESFSMIPTLMLRGAGREARRVFDFYLLLGRLARSAFTTGVVGSQDTKKAFAAIWNPFAQGFNKNTVFQTLMKNLSKDVKDELSAIQKEILKIQQKTREKIESDAEAAEAAAKKSGDTPVKRKMDIEIGKMSLPTGFLDIVEANRKVQESLIKDKDPTIELVGVAKVGNQMQQKMLNGMEKLVALTERNTEVRPQVATL